MTKRPQNKPPGKKPTPTSPRRSRPESRPSSDKDAGLYRSGVGITLFNRKGEVFVAERLDNPENWQMPQGGIDEGESPEVAVFREMEEEIGTRDARIIGVMKDWVRYDIPEKTAKRLWGGKYRGQQQKWIALEFLGDDADIDLEAHSHPEFSQWKWVPIADLLDYVVPFKREVYARVMKEFAVYAQELKSRKGK